ncbi:hypothetical protein KAT92_03380, partial [Candidatus Babeliales bacterium]|nr:hypothetical protein [Candidatus Babeliales bacterium]
MLKNDHNWLKRAVIYHILIDRFAGFTTDDALKWDYPNFVGGTIKGIIPKLEYLVELGINTLWLSPFYKNAAQDDTYHGYHVTDYFTVDERFGNINDLRSLINECHKRNMRIIADFVPNHCHESHNFFQKALNDANSTYRQWFHFTNKNYNHYLNCKWLPKFNLENKDARMYMIKAALFWIDLGLDGYRIDHVVGLSHSFLRELSIAVKQKHNQCVLIGEAVFDSASLRKYYDTIPMKNKFYRRLFGFN